jgi:hypothetical protein
MEISLKEFKERFYNDLIDIHWRHWSALGVSTHVRPERHWIIDLEPLLISSLAIGLNDNRLLSSSLEWLIKNGAWLNLSRLRRILRVFMEPFPGQEEPIITPEMFKLLIDTYNKNARNKIMYKKAESYKAEDNKVQKYKTIFSNFRVRNVVTKPKLRGPSLLQILLRGFFGVDAHVEILIYLLVSDGGNSNSIARETFYDQKNIYRILERWANAQMVTKVSGNKTALYSLNRKKGLIEAIGLKELPKYLNWTCTFLFLNRLGIALSTIPWAEDEYLLSSVFRDLSNEAKSIGKVLNVKVPEPGLYSGKKYFTPFGLGILNILKQLKRSS